MANTTYISSQEVINELQSSKGKTKLRYYQFISDYNDEMDIRRLGGYFQFKEDLLVKQLES